MKAGIAFGVDREGNVFGARFMGRKDQCLVIRMPLTEPPAWCVLPWPHESDHEWSRKNS